MPRGKHVNQKGLDRSFTNPEEFQKEEEQRNEEMAKWRDTRKESSSEDDEEAKGVRSVINVRNPNWEQKKAFKKIDYVDMNDKPNLTLNERRQISKQEWHAAFLKRHAKGKTVQAQADLARLAVIKQQREEAEARRQAEKKAKEEKKIGDEGGSKEVGQVEVNPTTHSESTKVEGPGKAGSDYAGTGGKSKPKRRQRGQTAETSTDGCDQ